MILRNSFALLATLTILPAALPAQDLSKARPAPVPPQVPPPEALTPADSKALKAGALPDEKILVSELKGVLFSPLPTPKIQSLKKSGFDTSAVPLLDTEEFRAFAPFFLGQPVSQESLDRLTRAIRHFGAQKGRPFVVAYLPPQDITDGFLAVVVQEAISEGPVKVEGATYFAAELYRSRVRQKTGQAINADELREDVDWLNRNPFRNVTASAEAGSAPGTTRLVLQARETAPWRVYGGYNNTGTLTSDEDRVFTGLNWGDAFNLGHQLNYQLTASPDFHTSVAHSGGYVFDLPWRHTVTLSAVYSKLHALIGAPFKLTGTSWLAGLRYGIPLPSLTPEFSHKLSAGLDFKSSDNNLLFSNIPVTDNTTHIAQLVVAYDAGLSDRLGRTDFGLTLTGSPGGLTDGNEDSHFNTSRALADSEYAYAGLTLSRRFDLPGGFSWTGRSQAQLANGNLLGSEQLGGGGSSSIRGYTEGEVYGDNGLILSHELATPSLPLLRWAGWNSAGDGLQLFAFQDYGRFSNEIRLVGEPDHVGLHSAGFGFRYHLRQNLSVNFAYGWQLRDSGNRPTDDSSRGHLSAQLSF